MWRRAFLALSTVALLASGLVAAQPRTPLVVVLINGTTTVATPVLQGFREGMRDAGYVEGRNYRMEVRLSEGRVERLPDLARELLRLGPEIAVANQVLSAQALHRESSTVPIVMLGGSGAQKVGLIESLAHPGKNVTGMTNQGEELTPKLFQLLREIAPEAKRVMTLTSGKGAIEAEIRAESRAAAEAYGMTLIEGFADARSQLPALRDRCLRERCEALIALADPNLNSFRDGVTALAASLRIPAVYSFTDFTREGGLLSYSADYVQLSRRAATYVDRILKGAVPGDLAIERPTKFELVYNKSAAKALGITIPPSIRVRADNAVD